MKHLLSFLLLALAWTIAPSCDVITEPFKENPNPVDTSSVVRGDTWSKPHAPSSSKTLQDTAARTAQKPPKPSKALDSIYGPTLIIPVALHAGPSSFTGVTTDYPTDFTTAEGDDIATLFGIFALPMGMVQRADYPTAHQKTYTAWAGLAAQEIASTPEALFTLSAAYDSVSRQAIVHYSAALQSAQTNALGVAVYLKESHILSPQLMPNNTRDEFYVHKNVLRAAPLGPTGIEVFCYWRLCRASLYRQRQQNPRPPLEPKGMRVGGHSVRPKHLPGPSAGADIRVVKGAKGIRVKGLKS